MDRKYCAFAAIPILMTTALRAADPPLVRGVNGFGTSAYQQLAAKPGNIIFSPFNIASALSMALAGARGDTASEIAKMLGQKWPDSGYDAALAALVDQLTKAGNLGENQLLNANSLWVDKSLSVLPAFEQTLQTHYGAPLTSLDFLRNTEAARAAINAWTDEHTKGKIHELFAPGVLDSSTRLVLTSAVYFYGKWQLPFKPSNTDPMAFHLAGGGTVNADFMNQTAHFGYFDHPSMQILEMKYAGTGMAMDILLPRTLDLGDVEGLDLENLESALRSLSVTNVDVMIPKFRVESSFSLKGVLSKLGMPSAFKDSADFSGIDGKRDLVLAEVIHKAFVDVSEQGTEAAAVTGGVMRATAMPPGRTFTFKANHPFVFLIRDTKTGVILFSGRVSNPKA